MTQSPSSQLEGCELDAELRLSDAKTASISYTFYNGSYKNAYLFNRLYRVASNALEINPDFFNAELSSDQLIISKKIEQPPDNIFVYKPKIPFVSLVPGGRQLTEEVRVSLPLRLSAPRGVGAEATAQTGGALRQVWFELGFFLASSDGDKLVKELLTPQGPALYFASFSASSQKLLRAGPFATDIPVDFIS